VRWTAAWRRATVVAMRLRIGGGSRDPLSLVVRAAFFQSASVLWLPVRSRGDRGSGRPYPGSSSIAAAEVALKTITLPRSG
jgi:hypothetical protein